MSDSLYEQLNTRNQQLTETNKKLRARVNKLERIVDDLYNTNAAILLSSSELIDDLERLRKTQDKHREFVSNFKMQLEGNEDE